MRRTLLRVLLVFDAVTLFLLGVTFIIVPMRVLLLFGFENAPPNIAFIVGAFGTVYATMGVGYLIAAQQPLRNVAWVQVAIARGVAECLFSVYCVLQGIVTFRQAGFSIIFPALVAVGCLVLYPRPEPPAPEPMPQSGGAGQG
jgi:hypothetical protein